MDDVARYNQSRWDALAEANSLHSRPALDLDPQSARQRLDPEGMLGEVLGKRVLCLASGGGQQSAAFAVLGARVTVFDIADAQLERDRQAAAHLRLSIDTVQGDMRDLSELPASTFDIVWHPYSINVVPDARRVFREVARVIRPDGLYCLQCANPAFVGLDPTDWDGTGYVLKHPCVEGIALAEHDQEWAYDRDQAAANLIPPPREYRHSLSTLVNGLSEQGFAIRHLSEGLDLHPNLEATPGTWDHFVAFVPPWFAIWSRYESVDRAGGPPGYDESSPGAPQHQYPEEIELPPSLDHGATDRKDECTAEIEDD